MILSLALVIGYRPLSIGSDTLGYVAYYNSLVTKLLLNSYFEYLFDFIARVIAYLDLPYNFFFPAVALISSVSIMFLALKLYDYLEDSFSYYRILLLLLSLLLISPFFFLSEVNVIRQGTAIGILFLSYLMFLESSWGGTLFLAFIALSFHYTIIFYLLGLPLLYCLSYTSIMRIGIILSLAYLTNINQYLLQHVPYFYNKIISYGILASYKRGTRYDFLLFTVGIGIVAHFLSKYLLNKEGQDKVFPLLSIYWILAFPFFIVGFGAYSDRYLLPCWLWISVVATVFGLFYFKRFNFSVLYYFIFFILSFLYFFSKIQGIIA